MRRILLAVDETEGSRRAAEFVERFFAGVDASITAVNVARTRADMVPPAVPFGGMYSWPPGVEQRQAEMIEDALAREEDRSEEIALSQAPADADARVVFGEAAGAIQRAADDQRADLIVVGSNEKGFLEHLLYGSVSEKLARHSSIPVLIVR